MPDVAMVRGWYAEEVRYAAAVKSQAIVRLSHGAARTLSRTRALADLHGYVSEKYWPTEDADPRCVYHNVVIGMLPEKGLNNGHGPWAHLFDQLDLGLNKRVLHLGCGAGYYSAILAEIVGTSGCVREVSLARAVEALAPRPQATAQAADAANYLPATVDIIIASAGATHPFPSVSTSCRLADSCCCRSPASGNGARH